MNPGEVMAITLAGITLGTAVFQGGIFIGRLSNRVDRHNDRLDDHDEEISELKKDR